MLALLAADLLGSLILSAQQAVPEVRVSAVPYVPATATLRVQSDLVEVGVVVRSRDGRVVRGLEKGDFYLLDKGAKREITSFAVDVAAPPDAAVKQTPPAAATTAAPANAPAAQPPRFIALHFDDFSTNAATLRQAQVAARRFINEGLAANDHAAVFTSSSQRLLDFTGDKEKLLDAIDKVKPHPRFSGAGLMSCPRISAYQAYLITVELDPAAVQAAEDEAAACQSNTSSTTTSRPQNRSIDPSSQMIKGLAEQTWAQARAASQETLDSIGGTLSSLAAMKQGRRLLLLVSSGFISGTLDRERDKLINQALHAGIVINALDAKGLDSGGPGRPFNDQADLSVVPVSTFQFETSSLGDKLLVTNQAMSDFAQATGGLFFYNNNDLTAGFHQLAAVPDVTYLLGFHRGDAAYDGTYHKLKVGFAAPKPYLIEARAGYFAAPPEKSPGEIAREQLDHEVMAASASQQQFKAAITYQLARQANGSSTVKVQVHFEITQLRFPVRDDRRLQQFRIITALLDEQGNLSAGKEGTMALALTDGTFLRLSINGIDAKLNLDAQPGKYRLRAVVQEEVDGKMASSTQPIELK